MSDTNLLASVIDLHIRFGDQTVVEGVSFDIAPGECLALVGESGIAEQHPLGTAKVCIEPVDDEGAGIAIVEEQPVARGRIVRADELRGTEHLVELPMLADHHLVAGERCRDGGRPRPSGYGVTRPPPGSARVPGKHRESRDEISGQAA